MKRLIGMIFTALLVTGIAAQTKVVEKSAKKVPEWLNTATEGYLVVSVRANSLAEGQTKALTEITERIIQSVASNVTVSKKNVLSEVNVNGSIESSDAFTQVSKIKSANLPFLKGISLSNAEEIYWEKVRDKATGKEHYDYSVKYPFSRSEQRKLIAEFEALDAEKVARYEALEQKISSIESVDEIGQAITELNTLSGYFFDDVRLSQVEGLTARYKQLYDALSLTGTFLENGKYQCQVLLDGNPVRVATKPKVTSNCAGQIGVRPADGMFVISYDAEDCLPEEENFLNISLVAGGKRLQHKAFLNEAGVGNTTFSVVPEGKLILTADSVAGRKIFNINIRLTLNNRGGTPFGLKALELHVPEISAPIIFDDIDGVYKTKGIVQIKALAEGEFTAGEKKNSAFSFVQGSVTFVNPQTGAVERARLSLPYITNWE
ncbi:hypothetical protein [Bacteroides gallinarum]|uniref:hypothetical protein n=1 Tax=Bacteroides gallinarum TaxID=376806 RepID=UPI00046AA920|nr:hypothetical protein [Bacteroides gallinarum]